jgi:hypothetical protein
MVELETGITPFYLVSSEYVFTSVDEDILSNSYALMQNYPNPFNPTTTIKFSIPNSQLVTIKVYDLLGREISTLVNEEKQPGYYEIKFNGTSLPSGVYFYRLQAGDPSFRSGQGFTQTKKLVLMK